jgi:hypothetical protein
MGELRDSFKGNKAFLPCKLFVGCARAMTRGKYWAKNLSGEFEYRTGRAYI